MEAGHGLGPLMMLPGLGPLLDSSSTTLSPPSRTLPYISKEFQANITLQPQLAPVRSPGLHLWVGWVSARKRGKKSRASRWPVSSPILCAHLLRLL